MWTHRHLLTLADLSREDYHTVFHTALSFQEILRRRNPKVPALQGKVVANLFFESSTRTRSSFELAAKRLSADVLNFSPGTSSLSKGETILDTTRTLLAMGLDILVVRHAQAGVPALLAADIDQHHPGVRVLNAGDGQHQHPTQALLDVFTLAVNLSGSLEGLAGVKIAIVGDILHSRVARSNIQALTTLGAEVHLAGPPTLVPADFREWGVQVHWQLEPALSQARFVMALRLQQERMQSHFLPSLREYHQFYGLTLERLQSCDPQVQVLHPGPVNRGVELASEVLESPCCLVDQQVSHGVAVRMAVLYLLGGGPRETQPEEA